MTPRLNSPVAHGRAVSKASRPQNIVYSGLLAGLAAYFSGATLRVAAACYLVILLLYGLAAVYNNTHDAETDSRNKRGDIQRLSPGTTRIYMACCVLGVWVLSFFLVQPASTTIILVYIGCCIAYSHPATRIMSRGFWATVLLGVCYGGLPFLLGAVQGGGLYASEIIGITLLQIGLIIPLLLAKDYKDKAGDTATGKLTPLVRYGAPIVRHVAYGSALLTSLFYLYLALDTGIPVWFGVALAVSFTVLIYRLHESNGVLSRLARLTLSCLLLMMTLSLFAWNGL